MTITELGSFLAFVESLFGSCTIDIQTATSGTMVKLRNDKSIIVATVTFAYGSVSEVWIRIDKIPPEKKKEAEKVLQAGRFETIVANNG